MHPWPPVVASLFIPRSPHSVAYSSMVWLSPRVGSAYSMIDCGLGLAWPVFTLCDFDPPIVPRHLATVVRGDDRSNIGTDVYDADLSQPAFPAVHGGQVASVLDCKS